MLKHSDEITRVLLAGLVREGGASVHPQVNAGTPKEGYLVGGLWTKKIDREKLHDYDVQSWVGKILHRVDSMDERRAVIGAWLDSETQIVYLDVSTHYVNKDRALEMAKAVREVAIWDCANHCEIRVA